MNVAPPSLERCSDAELLTLTGKTAEAFGIFYHRHVHAVLAYLSRRTGHREDALDLTAEVFAAALTSAARYRADAGPARAWLFGIANNKLAASRRKGRLDRAARRKLGIPRAEVNDAALQRVEELIDAAAIVHLRRMERLPPAEREAVKARVIDERDYRDIARATRSSEAAVRQRVSRGLTRLRRLG
ncbi:MAG TPA: RNA polymerase sigma factor [Thermoleophilaceae bacterium]|nr:RNA polymerase sigma factor [Thermoleophilaceae bacterium]